MEKREVWVKAYNKKELCELYKKKPRTFYNHFKLFAHKIGKPEYGGYKFSVRQVEILFSLYDLPEGTIVKS
jgi:hypothetical protein